MEVKAERIAEIIRKVDGSHSMGASALSDAIAAELEKDRELSDLEIVQKALSAAGAFKLTGSLDTFNDVESMLTWAKQTIGEE